MASLLIYNPENDTALAAGKRFFTPSKEPLRLAADGSLLPFWWADKGDFVFTDRDNTACMRQLCNRFDLEGEVFSLSDIESVGQVKPWGWSEYIKEKCLKAGINHEILPSDVDLEAWRILSHRRTTVKIHDLLGTALTLCPRETFTVEDTLKLIDHLDDDAVIKQPWSSSGRGVFYTKGMTKQHLAAIISGFIKKQGSVLVEKRRNRLRDFALLYYSSGSEITYKGPSYFVTSTTGEYAGNLVDKDTVLIDRIGHEISIPAERIRIALHSLFTPSYEGWIGVDMMVERGEDGTEAIVPCVEVNVRMTMGVVAHLLAANHPELCGKTLILTKNSPTDDEIDLSPVKNARYHYVLIDKFL